MVSASEEAAKRAKSGKKPKYMNEMGWALAVACGFAFALFAVTHRVSSNDTAAQNAGRPSHRTQPPASAAAGGRVVHPELDLAAMLEEERHGAAVGSTSSSASPSAAVRSAAPTALPTTNGGGGAADTDDENPMTAVGPTSIPGENDDPMTAVGPTSIPGENDDPMTAVGPTSIPGENDDPMAAVGPTSIEHLGPSPSAPEPPASTPPPQPSPPAAVGPVETVPWPRGKGNQPPTPNPVLAEFFTAARVAMFEQNDRRRADHTQELTDKFGTYNKCDGETRLRHCWNVSDAAPLVGAVRLDECPCEDHTCCTRKGNPIPINHRTDNATNWDMDRKRFCKVLREDNAKSQPVPAELLHLIDLAALDKQEGLPLPSGAPQGSLPFDPTVVQSHFFKAQAALVLYAEGTTIFTEGNTVKPTADTPEYLGMMTALARRFAASLIRGGSFVLAGNGDSTMAGADNCYYDNFLSVIERQLKPLLASAKVDFSIRNCGHNGG
jgi:hypothetical protein